MNRYLVQYQDNNGNKKQMTVENICEIDHILRTHYNIVNTKKKIIDTWKLGQN